MADVDPRIEAKLRQLHEHIEGTDLPSGLQDFDAESAGRRRRALTLAAAVGGTALVTVAVVVVGLSNHRLGGGPPAAALATTPVATISAAPAPSPSFSPSPSPSPSPSVSPDPTVGWRTYASAADGYSFRYPSSWRVDGPCPFGQVGGYQGTEVRVGPHPYNCGADMADGSITVDWERPYPYALPSTPQACARVSAVTIDGVKGTRTDHCGNWLSYGFTRNGRVYTISWMSGSSGAGSNLTADLDLIVQRTWTFSG